ncbi:MAG: STM4013/SEN3800 family hydrolase [Candidatus Obscuribacterales bacterium]|nr:STM4013/SEN3800 family hydrolase [Candidatus Obscuribacterales bacterium]
MLDLRPLIGTNDVLMVTLDALRYDVAQEALLAGLTPNLASLLPDSRWEHRHTPGSFTYSAHQAFFSGFLPTPSEPGQHERLFATSFEGSVTTGDTTVVFDAGDIIHGFAERGYHTVCVGGVGFFNKQNPLGTILPAHFQESHWNQTLGVTDIASTENQVRLSIEILDRVPDHQRVFLFLNVSALHQPNYMYLQGAKEDSKESQIMALAYVDKHLPRLIERMVKRAPLIALIFSDHGTAYGEDGFVGHRISHETVWTVPYSEFILPQSIPADSMSN